ncbi:tail fiber domain-containing protein [Streptomyces sp. ET3-23]|uniref:tail fiber domain-containing protein n=1 Tax=Streptomyces sp. ET3-23 TaxID=2885643 RepID=UPI001D11C2E8|nr:tail fiber domain-containing protein [Streptomyces sp. ET3-23]MCC2278883.1 tail fiber domain-containing protein [Streptomyces sp. ET3-23]
MAITSYPFDSQSVTETQFSQLFREFADSGVAASALANAFQVSADGTAMSVKVQPGFAIVRGHAVLSTAVETLKIAAAGTSTRYDRVILRLDPAVNSITLAVLQGAAGGSAPALTQTDTGIYELPLATVTVGANITAITSAAVSGDRRFVGQSVGAWVTSTRPASPRLGKLGLNYDTNTWEFWNGTAWTPLVASVSWSSLTGKPATFPPSSHAHQWSDITNAPTSLPPAAHKHPWGDITGTPSTYPPATHSHSWSAISDKPSTFPPSSHSHGSYLESGDTIAWSNGTKRAHSSSVSGSGTYYAVWVNGSGQFCRNTSSRRYKQNVRDISISSEAVLSLRPRLYDRRPDEGGGDYARDEFGLIAEEVAETLPEIVTYDEEGRIDALRYDLLGVALLPVVQDQDRRIKALEAKIEELACAS